MFIDINKKHTHRSQFKQMPKKRHKVWWGRAAGGSGSCAVLRVKPKLAMTKLYLVVGGAGNITNYNGTTSNVYFENSGGMPSGIGVLPDYSSKIMVVPGAPSFYTYSGNTGGTEPVLNEEELKDLFEKFEVVRLSAGNAGTAATLYNSYNAPSTTPGYSSYDGTSRGYGAGGYNAGNTNYAGVGGYIKVSVV